MTVSGFEFRVPSWTAVIVTAGLFVAGCGFHLRGTQRAELPSALSVLRVTIPGSKAAHDPLLIAMQNALRTQAGVAIATARDAPTLVLSDERIESQVLSFSPSGKVNEYLLKYAVGYRLDDAGGKPLIELQTLKLQRDYTFDPLNVLAKQKEEEELIRALREDAVQRILRRLARFAAKPPGAAAAERK